MSCYKREVQGDCWYDDDIIVMSFYVKYCAIVDMIVMSCYKREVHGR